MYSVGAPWGSPTNRNTLAFRPWKTAVHPPAPELLHGRRAVKGSRVPRLSDFPFRPRVLYPLPHSPPVMRGSFCSTWSE